MRDDSAELLFQPFLQEAFVSNSGVGRGDAISNIQPIAAENTLGDNWPFSVQSDRARELLEVELKKKK